MRVNTDFVRNVLKRPVPTLIFVGACVTAAISLYFAGRSIWLGLSEAPSLPRTDQWWAVLDYFRFLDGNYSLFDLFSRHNEHHIVTTRIILFLDTTLFSMRGLFPIIVMYATLAVIALLSVLLAFTGIRDRRKIALAFAIVLGLAWSTSQGENLSWAFQLCFPLVHLFALLVYIGLANALNSDAWSRLAWLAMACFADFLAVFSLGSGFLVGLPAIALVIWLRGLNWTSAAFLAVHAVLLAVSFGIYPVSVSNYAAVTPAAYFDTFAKFLVFAIAAWMPYSLPLGAALLSVFLVCCIVFTWRSIIKREKVDRSAAVFLALASFVVLEAAVIGYTRGLAPRFATPSMVFLLSLLGFGWRMSANLAAAQTMRLILIGLAGVAIVMANSPRNEYWWRLHIASMNEATATLRGGELPKDLHAIFAGAPLPMIEELVMRMRQLHLGPFE
jgi:hypothetical protein